jgi:hypothetical protein
MTVKSLVGAIPHSLAATYAMGQIKMDEKGFIQENKDVKPDSTVPEGFEKGAWQEHVRHMPGGLINFTLNEIVSDAPAVVYEVLPRWAGIAKLLHEGAIEPLENSQILLLRGSGGRQLRIQGIENVKSRGDISSMEVLTLPSGFRIVKNIPYYPSGLNGGYSTKFIIAKGVSLPKGDAGHSEVSCEDPAVCPDKGKVLQR